MLNSIAIKSTGQTYADVLGLEEIYRLYIGQNNVSTQGMFQLPALQDPNYRPQTHDALNISVASIVMVLSTIFLICRLVVKCTSLGPSNTPYNRRKLLAEDWLLIIGYISSMSLSILFIVETIYNQLGWHILDMHISSVQSGLRVIYVTQVIFILSTSCLRLSLTFFIRRLYANESNMMQLVCNVTLAINLLFVTGAIIAFTLKCEPIDATFDVYKFVAARCNERPALWSVMVIHILLDWWLVILPLGLIRQIKVISTRQRVEACLVFAAGLVACSISTVRFQFIDQLIPNSVTGFLNNPGRYLVIFLQCEACCAILASCLPAIKILVYRAFFPSVPQSRIMVSPSRATDIYDIERNLISGLSTPNPESISEKKLVVVRDVEFEILDKDSVRQVSIVDEKPEYHQALTKKRPEQLKFYNLGGEGLRPKQDGELEPDSDMDASTESLPLPSQLSPRPRSPSQLEQASSSSPIDESYFKH